MELSSLSRRRPGLITEDRCLKSAVILPLLPRQDGDYDILFEVRAGRLADQPGDVCFPGGALEPGEEPLQAAVREACEELCIRPEQLRILGQLDTFHTYNMVITPYAAVLDRYTGSFSADEVQEIFTVPLREMKRQRPVQSGIRYTVVPDDGFPYDRINGGKNYRWRLRSTTEYFYDCPGHTLWGISAKLLRNFLQILDMPEPAETEEKRA